MILFIIIIKITFGRYAFLRSVNYAKKRILSAECALKFMLCISLPAN